ncbi:MmyB family transcriptional regulator [Streptomyces sp. NPDC055663]
METARDLHDTRLAALVGELSVQDADFRRWGGAHHVAVRGMGQGIPSPPYGRPHPGLGHPRPRHAGGREHRPRRDPQVQRDRAGLRAGAGRSARCSRLPARPGPFRRASRHAASLGGLRTCGRCKGDLPRAPTHPLFPSTARTGCL